MRRAALCVAVLLASACASLRPGPTPDGTAVRVSAREKTAARREAIEAVLPLFLTNAARRGKSQAVETAVFGTADRFIGRVRIPKKKGDAVVEVRLDALSDALQKAGLVRPPGYEAGPEPLLIALGDRAAGPNAAERIAADAFETALFARGIQAQDADDQLIKMKHALKAKTEEAAAAEALAGGWAWLAAGRAEVAASREPESAAWRARARLSVALYGVAGSSEPARFDGNGEDTDVSSFSALGHALEYAAQDAARLVDAEMARRRAGRATIAIFLSGRKETGYLLRVIQDLRRTPGVEGAALVSWRALDDMPLLHAYTVGLGADLLTARLLRQDASLRIGSIETEDNRLTLEGPEIPESEDRGE